MHCSSYPSRNIKLVDLCKDQNNIPCSGILFSGNHQYSWAGDVSRARIKIGKEDDAKEYLFPDRDGERHLAFSSVISCLGFDYGGLY